MYVVVGGFARVVQGSAEVTRALDIVPSLQDHNLRRLERAIDELGGARASREPITAEVLASGEPMAIPTPAGTPNVIPTPWGTRGYDDIRIRGNRENLGCSLRPQIASTADLIRMLEASRRVEDAERLQRIRRMMELEHVRVRRRGRQIER